MPENADAEQLTAAFRCRAKEWHPDVNQDRPEQATEQMKKISLAYQTLNDPTRRAAYDLALQAERHRRMGAAAGDPAAAPQRSPRVAWWAPPEGSPVATVINDPAPPSALPTPPSNRHLRSATIDCFTGTTRTAWLVTSMILSLVSGSFVFFLLGAYKTREKNPGKPYGRHQSCVSGALPIGRAGTLITQAHHEGLSPRQIMRTRRPASEWEYTTESNAGGWIYRVHYNCMRHGQDI